MAELTQTILINGVNTQVYGIKAMKIRGVFDMPGRLGTYERDWKDVDGVEAFVEFDDLYFKQRKITIDFIMENSNIADFQYQIGQFRELVYSKFTLETPYSTHECVMKESAKVKFITNKYEPNTISEFTLIFNEISYDFGTTLEPDEDITNDSFWIDKIKLKDFGITVENADGNFDFPKMKTDRVTTYKRESDKVNKREFRNIAIKCSLIATDMNDFKTKISQFHSLLAQPELRELMMPYDGLEKPYQVFCANGFKVDELYQNEPNMVAKFTIVFREVSPSPESYYLAVLLDTFGVPILTTEGEYIYVVADRQDQENQKVYLYTPDENQENIYLWTTNEIDDQDANFNTEAEEVYLFTKEETE